jgi:hypothetical protein
VCVSLVCMCSGTLPQAPPVPIKDIAKLKKLIVNVIERLEARR